ncbi:MAG: beta-mannosidase, partial [Chitinophagaceae bacterium]
EEKKKIPALTEFGGNLADPDWWTKVLWPVLARHRISWVLGWRNAGSKPGGGVEFYVPYRGQTSAADFVKFYSERRTLFQQEIGEEKIYQ